MSRTRTLTNLIADVRQRAHMESSQFVTDSEITEYINESIAELYDLLLAARGQEYYVASTTFTTSSGVDTYSLPADFYQLLRVDVSIGADTFTCKPFMLAEGNAYRNFNSWLPLAWAIDQPVYYRLRAGNISFIPTPTGGYSITLWYVPAVARLTNGSDTVDGINGWEEYVVVDAAMKCLEKEESDTAALAARKAALTARIQALAPNRDAGHPETVTDVSADYARRWF